MEFLRTGVIPVTRNHASDEWLHQQALGLLAPATLTCSAAPASSCSSCCRGRIVWRRRRLQQHRCSTGNCLSSSGSTCCRRQWLRLRLQLLRQRRQQMEKEVPSSVAIAHWLAWTCWLQIAKEATALACTRKQARITASWFHMNLLNKSFLSMCDSQSTFVFLHCCSTWFTRNLLRICSTAACSGVSSFSATGALRGRPGSARCRQRSRQRHSPRPGLALFCASSSSHFLWARQCSNCRPPSSDAAKMARMLSCCLQSSLWPGSTGVSVSSSSQIPGIIRSSNSHFFTVVSLVLREVCKYPEMCAVPPYLGTSYEYERSCHPGIVPLPCASSRMARKTRQTSSRECRQMQSQIKPLRCYDWIFFPQF